jgi:imidazolonepropionase-like amidohydrolase
MSFSPGAGFEIAVDAGVDSIEHGTYLDEHPDLIAAGL